MDSSANIRKYLAVDLMNSVMFFGVSWFSSLAIVFDTIKISRDG